MTATRWSPQLSVHPQLTDGLQIRDLTVAFGGNVAVDSVSLAAPIGRITGLIGPNGAGKTTTFNACSGLLRPRAGSVRFGDIDVTHRSPARRARMGLGRTFQRVEVCENMTVAENVRAGCEARAAGAVPWAQFLARRQERDAIRAAVEAALDRCGMNQHADDLVGSLSTGRRRLVELARVLACGFPFLLLDEPSSGLDDAETSNFAAILREAVAELNLGILLVEHDMNLVMSTCDYIHVLDFGRHIFEGTPAEIQASPIVRAAYLGGDLDEGLSA
jgi:ABC-type branched-subunit amino acid transport system ATPase component